MIFEAPSPPPDALRRAIAAAYRADEGECVAALLARADLGPEAGARIAARAQSLVAAVRAGRQGAGGIDAFLQEYELTSQEGVVLMCLGETPQQGLDGGVGHEVVHGVGFCLLSGSWRRDNSHSIPRSSDKDP